MQHPSLEGARKPDWRIRAAWVAVWLLLAGVLVWAARSVDWAEVRETLGRADLVWVGLAVIANLCAMPLWTLAVRLFIPTGQPRPFLPVMGALAITVAAIQTFSVLGGAAAAAMMFVRRVGLSTGAMISVVTLEQLATGFAKAALVAVAILVAPAPAIFKAAGASLLLAVLVVFAVLIWAAHSGAAVARLADIAPGWLAHPVRLCGEWTTHLEALRRPLRFAVAALLTLGRRVMETIAILCVQKATGVPVSVEAALLVIAALALATIIPGPPGNVGYYEAVVVLAYGWVGVGKETAVAAALLQHLAFLAAALVPGYLLLAIRRQSLLQRAH